ncbi:hypothetical protein CA54_02000 [Symmachiella macrocystis]|uniref:SLA1 homology domain-containing protein n=1 Tax=Symmachiella macrocystis TaxID=2527985 RepID=A0A5C6BGV6_9PLAN|nr:hypothetical protein [Symmachiella macrocystis]TWU11393.1 hypothetical protein CA54_02000 [Symmachiella macrocystis]
MVAPRSIVGTVFLFLAAAQSALGDDAQAPQKPDIEFIKCRVLVVDALGQPVQGAVVMPSGFRTRAEPGSHWGWVKQRFGPVPKVKTGPKGIAEIEVPKFVTEKQTIGQVTWLVDNPDHVVYRADHDINDDPAEITLKDGYRIAATAVDAATTEPIKEHLYAVQSGYNMSLGAEWRQSKSGVLLSRVFDEAQITLRLVALTPGQPARFSDLITLDRADDGGRIFLRSIPLKPGTRVAGKLDPAVPRPVTGGNVVAFISAGEVPQDGSRAALWRWNDETKIQPDGSFVFESLPRGEVVQLIAVCNGWISKNPTQAELDAVLPWQENLNPGLANSFTTPQVFSLDAAKIEPTLGMFTAATCRIKVVDPDDKPLPAAEVMMWPNHKQLRGGSTVLGFGYRSTDLLRTIEKGEELDWQAIMQDKMRFRAKTNDEGVAVILNLPGRPNIGLNVIHNDFDQPALQGRRFRNVDLKPGESTEITIRMEPKGENELGAP